MLAVERGKEISPRILFKPDEIIVFLFILCFRYVSDIPFDKDRKYLGRKNRCLACFWGIWSECGQPPQHPNIL